MKNDCDREEHSEGLKSNVLYYAAVNVVYTLVPFAAKLFFGIGFDASFFFGSWLLTLVFAFIEGQRAVAYMSKQNKDAYMEYVNGLKIFFFFNFVGYKKLCEAFPWLKRFNFTLVIYVFIVWVTYLPIFLIYNSL